MNQRLTLLSPSYLLRVRIGEAIVHCVGCKEENYKVTFSNNTLGWIFETPILLYSSYIYELLVVTKNGVK